MVLESDIHKNLRDYNDSLEVQEPQSATGTVHVFNLKKEMPDEKR